MQYLIGVAFRVHNSMLEQLDSILCLSNWIQMSLRGMTFDDGQLGLWFYKTNCLMWE